MQIDAIVLRWTWTIGMSITLLASLWNMREALIDLHAVEQARRTGIMDSLRMQIKSEFSTATLLMLAIAFDVVAGVSSLVGVAVLALTALILQGATLGFLIFYITIGRKKILSQIILERRHAHEQGTELH